MSGAATGTSPGPSDVLYVGNDTALMISAFRDTLAADPEALVTTAAVSVSGADSEGTPIVGVTWPLSCDYLAHLGLYAAVLPATATLVAGETYTFVFEIDASSGRHARETVSLVAAVR